MGRERATADEWERYYERARRLRSLTGDPFRQHIARLAARERALLIGSAALMLVTIAAFVVLAVQS